MALMGEKAISKSDLRSLFGSILGGSNSTSASTSNGKENSSGDEYRKSNQTLIIRNCQLKNELVKIRKEMDSLRNENESLREKLRHMEVATVDEMVEMVIAQRVERKYRQLEFMATRTANYLRKAGDDFLAALSEQAADVDDVPISVQPSSSSQGLAKAPNLTKVEESPLRRTRPPVTEEIEDKSSNTLENTVETPPTKKVHIRPSSNRRKGKSPLMVPPLSRVTSRSRTPVPLPVSSPTPFGGHMDSARRKRSATLKIPSFKEPSLNAKIRRPASFDPNKDFLVTVTRPEEI